MTNKSVLIKNNYQKEEDIQTEEMEKGCKTVFDKN